MNDFTNDFTKEELQHMYDSLNGDESELFVGDVLLQDIELMIRGYCDHYWECDPRERLLSNPPMIMVVCRKCTSKHNVVVIDMLDELGVKIKK